MADHFGNAYFPEGYFPEAYFGGDGGGGPTYANAAAVVVGAATLTATLDSIARRAKRRGLGAKTAKALDAALRAQAAATDAPPPPVVEAAPVVPVAPVPVPDVPVVPEVVVAPVTLPEGPAWGGAVPLDVPVPWTPEPVRPWTPDVPATFGPNTWTTVTEDELVAVLVCAGWMDGPSADLTLTP